MVARPGITAGDWAGKRLMQARISPLWLHGIVARLALGLPDTERSARYEYASPGVLVAQ